MPFWGRKDMVKQAEQKEAKNRVIKAEVQSEELKRQEMLVKRRRMDEQRRLTA